ncbi:A-kinase anchor protein 6-like [Poecilia latipinna]|uniref:A-kinase anchor protein 6-like n=1 Tax=Poecilia latipinna TaxID=48699 RepID=UPI00072ED51E|nr:PREDICTED: A-kinase anchor protein 6-like [Poecilia latipinna]XP_014882277.1 PREDICTED: A-kinase anchor protein 6-like [Poecilia latipinna]XP_016534237.1 PREDICTED: A-kinase anchor protein 6-like [Poecilia formosa]
MSIATLSPVSPEPPSSKLMFIRDVEPSLHPANAPVCPDVAHQSLNGASSFGPESNQSSLTSEESTTDPLFSQRTKKLPPLHTGADWKVVLHLPEIEKWLRATSDRVAQLTHSVGQDSDNRHVDVHLVQLKVGKNVLFLLLWQLLHAPVGSHFLSILSVYLFVVGCPIQLTLYALFHHN